MTPQAVWELCRPGSGGDGSASSLAGLSREDARDQTAGALLADRQLEPLIASLARAGVPTIPWKGPWLARRLYGPGAIRPVVDLDLLVPHVQLDPARQVLRAAGYAPADRWTRPERALVERFDCEETWLPGERAGAAVPIELHWNWVPRFYGPPILPRDLWKEASPSRCGAAPCWALSPEAEFLGLCAHAWKHRWRPLRALGDAAWFAERFAPDWDRTMAMARRWDLAGVLRDYLIEVDRVTPSWRGTPLAGLAERLPDGSRRSPLARWIRGRPEASRFWPLASLERAASRARLVACAAVPGPVDFQAVRLPAGLSRLHWVLRPLRLLRDGILRRASYWIIQGRGSAAWGSSGQTRSRTSP